MAWGPPCLDTDYTEQLTVSVRVQEGIAIWVEGTVRPLEVGVIFRGVFPGREAERAGLNEGGARGAPSVKLALSWHQGQSGGWEARCRWTLPSRLRAAEAPQGSYLSGRPPAFTPKPAWGSAWPRTDLIQR